MSDEELSKALSILRQAASTEGYERQLVEDVDELIIHALRRAAKDEPRAVEIRAAAAKLLAWEKEVRDRGEVPRLDT